MDRVRVLVIDDSAFNRRTIVKMLEALPNVEVIGYACDGEEGLRKVIDLKPDLVTLDLEMPRMDGFTLLRIVMQKQPTPIIVVSSRSNDEDVFKALELGAVEFVPKPSARVSPVLMDIRDVLLEKVREVTKANLRTIIERRLPVAPPRRVERRAPETAASTPEKDFRMVVIGSSTGGPPALQAIFSSIQEPIPVGFAVAQHMPPDFTRAFADRLNRFSALEIREAVDGDVIRPGRVLIAPGGYNLEAFRRGDEVIVKVSEPKGHQRYIPSADVLFSSAATVFGSRLLGVVLTGMGNDGARGVQAVKDHGGMVLAEDEESCVVFGMPKEAIATGRVDAVVPLPMMCREILRRCRIVA
ncbi:MAG: chemotaxis response regulator protein-glutamate methylesterase [Deltaproteobacteria bacterium]|nr:MAG: chemotaxis response regulator protein-glutamate methylesterase [Deltaproteobacteria bacterium]